MVEHFVVLEKSVYFLEITVPEVALTEEIDAAEVVVGKSEHFICEKDGIAVVVDVEVVDSQFIETSEDFIA